MHHVTGFCTYLIIDMLVFNGTRFIVKMHKKAGKPQYLPFLRFFFTLVTFLLLFSNDCRIYKDLITLFPILYQNFENFCFKIK